MASLNQCNFIGNLGGDPEVKYTPNGKAVCNASIAVSDKYKDQERVEWVKIVSWGKLAEVMGEYLHKGSSIFVSGRLQTRTWDDSDGNKKYMTEVVINQMQMLSSKGRPQTGDNEYPVDGNDPGPAGTNPGDKTADGGEIPF